MEIHFNIVKPNEVIQFVMQITERGESMQISSIWFKVPWIQLVKVCFGTSFF